MLGSRSLCADQQGLLSVAAGPLHKILHHVCVRGPGFNQLCLTSRGMALVVISKRHLESFIFGALGLAIDALQEESPEDLAVEQRASPIHGQGLFAVRNLTSDEPLMILTGVASQCSQLQPDDNYSFAIDDAKRKEPQRASQYEKSQVGPVLHSTCTATFNSDSGESVLTPFVQRAGTIEDVRCGVHYANHSCSKSNAGVAVVQMDEVRRILGTYNFDVSETEIGFSNTRARVTSTGVYPTTASIYPSPPWILC